MTYLLTDFRAANRASERVQRAEPSRYAQSRIFEDTPHESWIEAP